MNCASREQRQELDRIFLVVDDAAGQRHVEGLGGRLQIGDEIAEAKLDAVQCEGFLHHEAFQVGTCGGLDGHDLCRAGVLQHVRVPRFQRPQLQHAFPCIAAWNMLFEPVHPVVFAGADGAGARDQSRGIRQSRGPLAFEKVQGVLRGGRLQEEVWEVAHC